MDTDKYDIILGYTADDQYFSIFKDFIDDRLSFLGLCKAMMLGDLGYQYVLRSLEAYRHLKCFRESERIPYQTFGSLSNNRRDLDKYNYSLVKKEHSDIQSNELFFSQIIKHQISAYDPKVSS